METRDALLVAADKPAADASRAGRNVIAIRTHYVNDDLLELARQLAVDDQYEVVFAIDERARAWETAEFAKLSLTIEAVTQLGLYIQDDLFLWKFGDYILYMLRQFRPDAPYVWLLENDVLINFDDQRAPFRALDLASNHDLLGTYVEKASSGWFWKSTVADLYPEVYRCFFPFIRISARAADHLFKVRREASLLYGKTERFQFNRIPNDEAFVASDLVASGFSIADINQIGTYYSARTFDFSTLFDRHAIRQSDDLLYHSVLTGAAYVAKLNRLANIDCRAILEAVRHDIDVPFDLVEDAFVKRLRKEIAPFADNPKQLLDSTSVISQALDEVASPDILDRVAETLAQGLKPKCLVALKRDYQGHFGDKPGPFPNIALSKPATQSSTCVWSRHKDVGRDAAEANNGRLDVAFGCHTDEETSPWWQVDLGEPSLVYRIRIQNRKQLEVRLTGFELRSSLDGQTWTIMHAAPAGIAPGLSIGIEFTEPMPARHLRLTIPGRTILHIVEFEAYGRPVEWRPAVRRKVAIGVLAHSAPLVLEQTLRHWPADSFTIFVHVDSKVDIELFRFVENVPNARLIESRIDIFWGGFNMVLAEIELMRACLQAEFDYFVLLSDDTVPLSSSDSFMARLENPVNWKTSQPDRSSYIKNRYDVFVCYDIWPTNPRHHTPDRAISIADFNVLFELRLLMEKGKVAMPDLFHGSQWTGLSAEAVRYLVNVHDTDPDIRRSFRFSSIPDEMYVHTILGRSVESYPLIDRFMYADFSRRPSPYILTDMSDLEWAIEHEYLFARKVRDPDFATRIIERFAAVDEDADDSRKAASHG